MRRPSGKPSIASSASSGSSTLRWEVPRPISPSSARSRPSAAFICGTSQ
eukprot:ctg_4405.g496